MAKRVFLIVLDSFGIGEMPDAGDYGDEGSNTLASIEKSDKFVSPMSYKVILPIMDGEEVKYPQGRVLDDTEWGELSKDDKDKCVEHYLFDEYFKTIIMPYVMQVIPSTTILKLKDFSA